MPAKSGPTLPHNLPPLRSTSPSGHCFICIILDITCRTESTMRWLWWMLAVVMPAAGTMLTDDKAVFSRTQSRPMNRPFWFRECVPIEDPYLMFTNHCESNLARCLNAYALTCTVSAEAPNTQIFLHNELKRIYSNSSITVTTSGAFNLLAYAGQTEDPILMRELEMDSLKRLVYIPPASRRYGSGVVAESIEFGG